MNEIKVAENKTLKLTNVLSRLVRPEELGNLPVILTQCIVIFQDTSLVYVIALGDFFGNAVRIGERDGTVVQMLLFAGLIYWAICATLSGLVKLVQGRTVTA